MKQKNVDEHFNVFKKDIFNYIELKLDYLKLEFIETFSLVYSKIITAWVVVVCLLITSGFMLIALALYLGKLWKSYHLGFLAVGGVFFVFMIIFFIFRKKILTNPMVNLLISIFFEKKVNNELKKKL